MSKRPAPPEGRNHVAKAVWTPRFKPQVVADKRKQAERKPSKQALRAAAHT